MDDCIFCKIATKEIPADIRYEDEELIAFPDINPIAPIHLLIIPKKHIPSLIELSETEVSLVGKMAGAANKLAKRENIAESGYRVVINCGEQGGQGVFHLHMHLLGGRQLSHDMG